MNQDRLNEINRLSDLLWNEELECWHDEDVWRTILQTPCGSDETLILDVCDFTRTANPAYIELLIDYLNLLKSSLSAIA